MAARARVLKTCSNIDQCAIVNIVHFNYLVHCVEIPAQTFLMYPLDCVDFVGEWMKEDQLRATLYQFCQSLESF